MQKLNLRLKELRNVFKLTQKQFAEVLEIKQSYYSALEIGKKSLEGSKVPKILFDKMGVSPEWFYNGVGNILNNSNGTIDGVKDILLNAYTDNFVKKMKKSDPFTYKFGDDLRKERPELANLVYSVSEYASFTIDIEKVYERYLDDCLQEPQTKGYKNYFDYKNKKIKYLEQFLKYAEAIQPLIEAMRKFVCIDFPKFDEFKILDLEYQASLGDVQ